MFTATLFTTAKTWKQTKCPSADEWSRRHGTYIQWNITQPQTEQTNDIYSNMGGPRDCHTE